MQDASKTTYQDLSGTSTTGVNALINGVSQEEKAALHEPTALCTQAATLTPPAIGQYWPGQGGYYAGIVRDGDKQWRLILASILVETTTLDSESRTFTEDKAPISAEWGKYPNEIPGEFSRRDGQHNTALILAAEPDNEIAAHFTALLIDGHKDFYWPSQFEQNLLLINLPEHLEKTWHWSSTQYSAHSAWIQDFVDGYQLVYDKLYSLAARAVRRLPI